MHTLAPWTWRWNTSCSLNVDRPGPTLHQWTRQLSRDALSSHCNSYPSLFHTFWGLKTRFRASWPQLTPGLAGTTKALRVPGTWTVPPGSPFLNSNLPGAHGNETDSLPGALPGGKSSSAQLLRQGRRGIAGRCDFFFLPSLEPEWRNTQCTPGGESAGRVCTRPGQMLFPRATGKPAEARPA